jgi:small nuclear ribonucleoprotein (snRNP)-like protein
MEEKTPLTIIAPAAAAASGVPVVLERFLGQTVVIDLRSPYVCLGTLEAIDEHHVALRDADMHDLRDSKTSREIYIVESRDTGIKRNRKNIVLMKSDLVGMSRLADVVDD